MIHALFSIVGPATGGHVILAYIDPGTGSLIIQAIIGSLLAAAFIIRAKFEAIRDWVRRLRHQTPKD